LLNERILQLCDTLGLAEKIDERIEALSTGMKQRLSLIRALLSDPPVVVLDEPTRALDPIGALAFRAFVKNRLIGEQKKTVLVATNLLEEARMLCDRVAVLHDHRIAAVGNADDLLTPAFLTAFTDALPKLGVSSGAAS
jgi:ABC-type multidrug transport system ATPase subunit